MLTEKQQQARNLYFQTDLNKTQIAELLNVSRRSLHYWIRENNWDRLKKSAVHLPAMMAENCYFIIRKFTESLLNERRIMTPITFKEADTLHKLALTIGKLKNHSTVNESMEMFGFFMERMNQQDPKLADQVMPYVNDYMHKRADIYIDQFKPEKMNEIGMYPEDEREDPNESRKDHFDEHIWAMQRDPESSIAKFFPQPFDPDVYFPDTPVPENTQKADSSQPAPSPDNTPPHTHTPTPEPSNIPSPSESLPADRQGPGEASLAHAKERIRSGETFYDMLVPGEEETARRRALLSRAEEFIQQHSQDRPVKQQKKTEVQPEENGSSFAAPGSPLM